MDGRNSGALLANDISVITAFDSSLLALVFDLAASWSQSLLGGTNGTREARAVASARISGILRRSFLTNIFAEVEECDQSSFF